jgi:hypothetical protein
VEGEVEEEGEEARGAVDIRRIEGEVETGEEGGTVEEVGVGDEGAVELL